MPDQDAPIVAPRPRQSGLRPAIVPVSLGLGGLALMTIPFWGLFENQREDVALARAFLTHIAANERTEANALMAPALADQIGVGGLERLFGQIEPWDHIGFSSRNTNGIGEMRTTELYGVGEALSGCESALHIQIVNGLIHSFNVTPVCARIGANA